MADPRCCRPPRSVAEVLETCLLPDAFFVALSAWLLRHTLPVEGQPPLDWWEELIVEVSGWSPYLNDTTNETTWERPTVTAVAAAAAAAVIAFHLHRGNVNATTKPEVPVSYAPMSPPLELEGKEGEDKGTALEPEPEFVPGGISKTVATKNAEEEVDSDGDMEVL